MCIGVDCRGEDCIYHGDIGLRGLLNLAILSIILRKPAYGSEIHRELREHFGVDAPRPLIYTLLRRMEGRGLVVSTWDVEGGGPARRVYRITGDGVEYLRGALKRLRRVASIVESIVSSLEEGLGVLESG